MTTPSIDDVPFVSPLQCYICVYHKAKKLRKQIEEEAEGQVTTTTQTATADPPANILCKGCKVQRYCGLNHLVEDRDHRDICRELLSLQKSQCIAHPLLLNGEIKTQPLLQQTIGQIMLAMRVKLRRRLTRRESELIGYPAYCAVCFRLDELTACTGCGAISYCSPEHQRVDRNKHTPSICQTLALYCTPYRWLDSSQFVIKDFHQRSPNLALTHLIDAFHLATGIHITSAPWRTFEDYQRFATCSSFSGIGCICFGLTNIAFEAAPDETVSIFVVGATEETRNYFREMHLKFFFLQYQDVCQLDIYLIGHKMQPKTRDVNFSFELKGCTRKVVLRTFSTTFERYVNNKKVDPVLIIIYNPDFAAMDNLMQELIQQRYPYAVKKNEVDDYDWRASLSETLLTYGVPICITSPTIMQSRSDMTYINVLAKELDIVVKPICNSTDNPYREILPLHNPCPHDDETVIYVNNYMQVIFTSIKC